MRIPKVKFVPLNKETMKEIPAAEGYYADYFGNIYSAWVTGKKPYTNINKLKKLTIIAPTKNCKYWMISIKINGKLKRTGVHRLVCMTFNGLPKEENLSCSHLDGNSSNNTPSNLIWESQKDNLNRKIQHGTDDNGVRNSRAKVDQSTLDKIRNLLKEKNLTHSQIGDMFGVSRVFISKIANGYRYSRC